MRNQTCVFAVSGLTLIDLTVTSLGAGCLQPVSMEMLT